MSTEAFSIGRASSLGRVEPFLATALFFKILTFVPDARSMGQADWLGSRDLDGQK